MKLKIEINFEQTFSEVCVIFFDRGNLPFQFQTVKNI